MSEVALHLVTRLQVEVVRRRPATVLKLSPLLRHALATASARGDGQPLLLPTAIPSRCCYNLFRCKNLVRWRVGDGQNHVLFCQGHYDAFMETHEVFDFASERWKV